jgi:hypothetical protein|tara:strand:- start:272 stop:1210 length:939 start_codon:yes stop_codon:yes gene_type:complete
MIELIEDKETQEQTIDYSLMLQDCLVDLNKELKPIEPIVHVGFDYKGQKVAAITRFECSCIYAPSKAKKSFAKSLIEAAYIGGNTSKYTKHFSGTNREDRYIISIDTEQGEFYAQRSFRRVGEMVGKNYENYIPIQLRKKSVNDRLGLIRWLIYESNYKGKIDLITIDGLADLVANTNDIVASTELAEEVMKWTAEGLHVCFILHKNSGSQKARGHIGTVSTIKAETLISIDNITDSNGNITEKNTVKISCSHSRGMPFEDFYLTVNEQGLPFTHTDRGDNVFRENESQKYEEKPLPLVSSSEAFDVQEIKF